VEGGHHHLGTTRMSLDPSQGVVDPTSRMHGIANLYVAGGSVFPTSGSANPTLTIVALALRLAAHLQQRLAA
jgi:choline dehydrogenase-like flavoprotein